MADWFEGDFSNPYNTDPYEGGTSVSDYPKAFGARAAGAIGDLGAIVRSLAESRDDPDSKAGQAAEAFGQLTQNLFGELENSTIESLTPTAKRNLQSTFSDPNFWSLSSMALKTANMAPDVVAAVVPSLIFPGVGTAVAVSAMQGAALSAGSVVDDMYRMTDELSDTELQRQVPAYRQLRADGIDEKTARAQYNEINRGLKPLYVGVIGAITNSLGPAGMAARGVAGGSASALAGAEAGLARRIASGAVEGGVSEAIQSGTEDYAVQSAGVEGGLQDGVDWRQVAENSATGAVLGGVLGGGIGGVAGGHGRPEEHVSETESEVVDVAAAPEASTTTSNDNTPVTQPEAAIPESAPAEAGPVEAEQAGVPTTAQEMQARKNFGLDYGSLSPEQKAQIDGKLAGRDQPVTVVDASSPDPAQDLALKTAMPPAAKPEATPEVTPVVTPPQEAPQIEVPTSASPDPVVGATPASEAPVGQDVAEPAPMPVQAEAAPTGPRILEDVSQEGQARAAEVEAARQRQLDQNMSGIARAEELKQKAAKVAVVGEGQENVPAKISKATRDAVIESKRKAAGIVETHLPTEAEHGVFSTNVTGAVSARKAVLARAEAMVGKAEAEGVKIHTSLKNNRDADLSPTAADVLLTEAKGLVRAAAKAKAEGKELSVGRIKDFITREYALRNGDVSDILETRRAEGDAAKKVGDGVTDNTADTTEAESVYEFDGEEGDIVDRVEDEEAASTGNPEDALIKREEAGNEVAGRERAAPAKVQAMGDGEGYTVPKAGLKAPKIEAIKKRKLNKKAEAPRAEAKSESEGSRTKRDELMKRIAEKKKAEAPRAEAKPTEKPTNTVGRITSGGKSADVVTTEGNDKPTTKERIEKAREETDTNPTQKQAEAGNYKKGRVSVHGLPVAIENPKGSTRSNKDPNGPKWSVKMPADYGYIEGTVGADGDALDVYIGPDHDAGYIYVIDQIDPETGMFDEHKVMVGFDSPTKALRTYDKAFSDGLGVRRAGQMHKMTLAEFKAWAETPASERTKEAKERHDDMMTSFMLDGFEREGYVMDPRSELVAKPTSVWHAGDLLNKLDLSDLKGVQRAVAGNARSTLMKLVGDMDVHFLSREDMARLSGYPVEHAPYGTHVFKGSDEKIFVRDDLLTNPEKLRHTVLHELTHAATVRAIIRDRQLEADINLLRNKVAEALLTKMDNDAITDMRYGLVNTREFIAETFSNPRFQELLAGMPADPDVVSKLGLDTHGIKSVWDAMVSSIRRILGMPKNAHSLLEASIRVTEQAMRPLEMEMNNFNALLEGKSFLIDRAKEAYDSINTRRELAPTKGNPALIGLRTFDNIARAADRYFGGNNPVRRVADLVEQRRVAASKEFDRAAPIINKLRSLSHKYRGQVWNDFTALVHDETMAGVYADRPLSDQKHITKGPTHSWQRGQHPELAKRFAALPDDLKAARKEAMQYFKDKQNEAALKLIRNRIVAMFDTPDPEGLAQRIHERTATDADKALLGEVYDTIEAAGVLSKINGPYLPLMRRGNFVVKGKTKVTSPGNSATKLADNEFEFKDKDAAAKWAADQTGRPTMRTVYVDKATGLTTGTENGKTVRLTAEDLNAEARYRVVVQDRFMEMFDSMKEARNRVAELRAAGVDADDAVPRAFEGYGIQNDALSVQMRNMFSTMERRADARSFTPEQKHELMTALNEMSLSVLGSTRIQSRSLQRTFVAGASKDLVRNTADYAYSMGNYVAKLDTRPELDAALEALDKAVKAGGRDGMQAGRTAIQNEVMRRVTAANPATENKKWNAFTSRLLSMSFIDKLMSPSYSVVNAIQPMMTTMPYLAGHYGAGRAFSAMSKAYADIGSMKAIQEGFAETVAKMKPSDRMSADPLTAIRGRLKKPEQALIDILVSRGVIDADSSLEVGQVVRDTKGIVGALDGGIGYLEGIARQFPKTVETINRTVTAVAAYRLEMERSGDVARATQFAQDTVNLTQFNYSTTNASPFVNHPVFRLSLQFKKYGVGMYQLMGEQAAIAWRNENPGDRAKAIKALSYTIGMHVLMAGAMGLPTEPIKLIVTAANGLGVTDWSWGDVENAQREAMSDLFGKQFGEVLSRGVPRLAGIDLSTRVGLDSLMGPFGEPRSNEAQDWKAYMWDLVGGAPAGLVGDWGRGLSQLAQGDVVRAAEYLIPVKTISDSIKAYRTFTEGTVSVNTGKQTMTPYSLPEALTRGLGFTPAREAETFSRQSAYYRGEEKANERRKDFQREWVESNGAARGRLWKEITKWNRSQPVDARLTLGELRGYQKRMKSDMLKAKDGIKANKRTQYLLNRADETYNY